MIKFIKNLFKFLKESKYKKELLRFAQSEYSRDWEYAYHMLLQGKRPTP
jgi:hypothetical protein